MSKSAAVDVYIAKSADFARPILKRVRAAMATYEALGPSQQREYVEWMAAGKPRNWKYLNC